MSRTFGPYCLIRQAGDSFYLAGHVGVSPDTKEASENIVQQTAQALVNLQTTLADNNLTLDDIVKTTVFLTNMDDATAMNEEYVKHFTEPRPARSTIAVKELPRVANVPLKVEIEAIAYKKESAT